MHCVMHLSTMWMSVSLLTCLSMLRLLREGEPKGGASWRVGNDEGQAGTTAQLLEAEPRGQGGAAE